MPPSEAIVSSKDESTDVQLDISKYEGHSPAPWQVKPVERFPRQQANAVLSGDRRFIAEVMKYPSTTMIDQCKVNAKLIVDAPLLLEEVKTLQRKLMLAESALGEIRAYHESGQGNLGEIIEHYQENEQVEMPNAFDEDDA